MSYFGDSGIDLPCEWTRHYYRTLRDGESSTRNCSRAIEAGPEDRQKEESEASMKACPSLRKLCWAQAVEAQSPHSFPDAPWHSGGKMPYRYLRRAGWRVHSSRGCSRNIL